MRSVLLAIAAALVAVSFSSVARADLATSVEQDAGCPAALPTIKAQNGNYSWLDRSGLTKECLRKLYEQNGDGTDADDDEDDAE